jgi:hypothetical protein
MLEKANNEIFMLNRERKIKEHYQFHIQGLEDAMRETKL